MTTRSVPDNDSNWGADIREVIARKNQLTDDATGKVPIAQLGTGTPSSSNFLRGDGTFAAQAGSASQKSWEDLERCVWAASPSTESGLTALSVNASTDDAGRIQAALNYLNTTYGRGARLIVPKGTSNVNSAITIPAGVQVVGRGGGVSFWDFWFAGTGTFTAVTVADDSNTPIAGLQIKGQQWSANNSGANVTTNTGLMVTGHNLDFVDVTIGGFNRGVDITNDNTYIIGFDRCTIQGCMTGLNADLMAVYHTGTANSNSGERIAYSNGSIVNCGTAFIASADGLGLFFTATSIDFCNVFAKFRDCHVFFENCHLETTYSTNVSTMGSDGTPARYLFDMDANPRLYMSNCLFIMGTVGIYNAINISKSPWNVGTGFARFENCGAAFGSNPAAGAAVNTGFSEPLVPVATSATTVTIANFFVTRWNGVKVTVVALDGGAEQNVTARISAISTTNGTVVATLGGAAPAGTVLQFDF